MNLRPCLRVSAFVFVAGCNRTPTAGARPDATVAVRDGSAGAAVTAPTNAPPENLLVTLRGATLRRATPLLFPQGGAAEVVDQLSRQMTPGIAGHGDEVDVDSPFAVAGTITGDTESTLTFFVAWPLRPGMAIAQQARTQQGYRLVRDGLYAPSSPDAGANADNQCWVGQRAPVGWMLICGPREGLPAVAGYLHQQANTPPENAAILDVDLRAALLRRLLTRQLAELDAHAPPPGAPGVDPARRAMFEDARRSAGLLTALANDTESFHGAITQDENAMHLRVHFVLSHTSSDQTRALLAATVDHTASASLVQLLPASVSAYIVGGFDRTPVSTLFPRAAIDPELVHRAGPELASVMSTLDETKSLLPLGERVDAYSNEDGYTMYHVIRRADAVQFVNDLRVAVNSIPSTALPEGGTLRDVATVFPTPGLPPGTNALRIGRNVHIPPGVQVPPEVRAVIERSMLLVAEGDHVTIVLARDPMARYLAMSQGARLAVTLPAQAVMVGHVNPPSFAPLFFGATIPGLPETHTTDALDFALTVTRLGDGLQADLHADAPINAAMELRTIYAMIQELQARMAQQMMQQQRAMQQQQQGGGGSGAGGPMGIGRSGRGPQPRLDPSMLPEPPHMQLQPPQ